MFERSLIREGHTRIAGVDEVGRGSLAGPVVAAAVVLPLHSRYRLRKLADVRDSKQLTPEQRSTLFHVIMSTAMDVGIGWATHHFIDAHGIGPANGRALHRAVLALRSPPHALLLDHFGLPECALPQLAITRGDAQCLSIAAASIIAKVFRDRWMSHCDARFPGYGFAQHKGYGTASHRAALRELGPCPLHRRSFSPVLALEP